MKPRSVNTMQCGLRKLFDKINLVEAIFADRFAESVLKSIASIL
jgi:hypothetical protein